MTARCPCSRLLKGRELSYSGAGNKAAFRRRLLFNGADDFTIDTAEVAKAYDGYCIYKVSWSTSASAARRDARTVTPSGDTARIQQKVLKKRLTPTEVLRLIEGCNLARDAFLIVLLYNTGLRIGEALGLHHIDIDLLEKVIWVISREDNANGARAKSGRIRGVPVHDYVLNMYVDYLTSDEYLPVFESSILIRRRRLRATLYVRKLGPRPRLPTFYINPDENLYGDPRLALLR